MPPKLQIAQFLNGIPDLTASKIQFNIVKTFILANPKKRYPHLTANLGIVLFKNILFQCCSAGTGGAETI